MQETMWTKLRKSAKIKQIDLENKFNLASTSISRYEHGRQQMPLELQIEYLKFRNSESDKIIIKYLEEIINERKYKKKQKNRKRNNRLK